MISFYNIPPIISVFKLQITIYFKAANVFTTSSHVRSVDEILNTSFAVRSSSETEKQYLIDQLTSLTETLGGNVEIAGPYPGWEYKADSRLREVMVEAYKHLYNGEEPVVEGIHAGLECGICFIFPSWIWSCNLYIPS